MKVGRRNRAWAAVVAMVLYGLVPVLASLLPAQAAPLACVARPVHTCSCQVGPHAVDACCCDKPVPVTDCEVGKLPCDGGSGPEVTLTFGANPLHPPDAPATLLRGPARRAGVHPGADSPVVMPPDTLTPPPKPVPAS